MSEANPFAYSKDPMPAWGTAGFDRHSPHDGSQLPLFLRTLRGDLLPLLANPPSRIYNVS
jgi:hypothetical protein